METPDHFPMLKRCVGCGHHSGMSRLPLNLSDSGLPATSTPYQTVNTISTIQQDSVVPQDSDSNVVTSQRGDPEFAEASTEVEG